MPLNMLSLTSYSDALVESVFLEYARHMLQLGHRSAVEYYCNLAGEKGKMLSEEIKNLYPV